MSSDIARKYKILVVDDDPDVTLKLKRGLEEKGFAVAAFNDPINVISQFKPEEYDLVLLDTKMPGMNGFELYGQIERVDRGIKVFFMTSFIRYYESLSQGYQSVDISRFIKKPIDIDSVVRRIKDDQSSA
jgi:DNA-binding NtrC family response regulator